MEKLFEIEKLSCSYEKPYREGLSKIVLDIQHLVIPRGKKVFIVGESGIGKSTILETLGLMNDTLVPKSETRFLFYEANGNVTNLVDLWKKTDRELSEFRLKHFSFIFQSTNLMRNFTAYENIALTCMLQGYSVKEANRRARTILTELGIGHIDEQRMTQELSGGQQQRLAFARAILPDFTVLFGDEPTGNLDSDNAVRAMHLLSNKLSQLKESSAVIVSHDMQLATTFADVIVKIRRESRPSSSVNDEEIYWGVIDQKSLFTLTENGCWSNGEESYATTDFEVYLKG